MKKIKREINLKKAYDFEKMQPEFLFLIQLYQNPPCFIIV